MKICLVATRLFHVDGQMDRHDEANARFLQFVSWQPGYSMWMDRWTDMMKLMLAFCNFVNAPKYYLIYLHYICSLHTASL